VRSGATSAGHRSSVEGRNGLSRGSERTVVVETELNARRRPPSQPPLRQRIALEGVERAVVPDQDAAAQLWPAPRDVDQQFVQARGCVFGGRAREQVHAGVDIPAQDEHAVARGKERPPHQTKVIRAILNARKSIRALDAPAVPGGVNDRAAGAGHVARHTTSAKQAIMRPAATPAEADGRRACVRPIPRHLCNRGAQHGSGGGAASRGCDTASKIDNFATHLYHLGLPFC
jgi:hypothetical protein